MKGFSAAAALAALLVGHGSAAGAVLLNEILADPARDWNGDSVISSRDDEWVEIVNTSGAPMDLAGYRLSSPDTTWRYEFSGTLAPRSVRVVYGSESYAWEQANGEPAFGLRLSNTGGEILLWCLDGDSTIVDRFTWKDHEAEDDRSSGRLPDGGPWALFDGLFPYTGATEPVGTGCAPSPGALTTCAVGALGVSWGRVKGIYR
jgi:hypothetical protein